MRFTSHFRVYALLVCTLVLGGCASFQQGRWDVYRRDHGGLLKPWLSANEASEMHWSYAWASVAAYQDAHDDKRRHAQTRLQCLEPHTFLRERGWVLWDTLPSLDPDDDELYPDAAKTMSDEHLRVQVWSNAAMHTVVVAFGGTAFRSAKDWEANLRWLMPWKHVDEYTVLTDSFVPAFIQEYHRRKGTGWTWLEHAQVISTGHSLGGGLAQRFAYSLDAASGVPVVTEVYAFDSSPVSGKLSTKHYKDLHLTIYLIYSRGEILAGLRSILALSDPHDMRNKGQTRIGIRYANNYTVRTFLHAHNMQDLTVFMARNIAPYEMDACRNDDRS